MSAENDPLVGIIKRNLTFKVKELEIENSTSHEEISRLEQIMPSTMIRIRATPETGRERSFTLHAKIDENLTATRLGGLVEGFRKVGPYEDVTEYLPESMKLADQIVEALNRALRQKASQRSSV